jgi:hypothetical protein
MNRSLPVDVATRGSAPCEITRCSRLSCGHAHAVALHMLYYNFVRMHKTLRMMPAMAAGVTKRLWEMSDVVDILEAWENCHA